MIQIGLRGVPPFSGAAIRFAIAAVLLLALALARGVSLGRTPGERRLWVANGLLSFAVSYGVVYWVEQWVPSGLTAVLFATYPLWVTILAHLLLPDEPWTWREGLGTLVGFAGVATIFTEDLALLGGAGVTLGATVMLLSPLASAAGSVVVKKWGARVHPLSISAVPMAICSGVMAAMALGFERERAFVWDGSSIGAIAYLALAGSAVTFSIYYWLLTHLPAKRLALIAYIVPIVAVLIGVARGEPLTGRILAGASLVVVGVALAVQQLGGGLRSPEAAPTPAARSASDGPRTTG